MVRRRRGSVASDTANAAPKTPLPLPPAWEAWCNASKRRWTWRWAVCDGVGVGDGGGKQEHIADVESIQEVVVGGGEDGDGGDGWYSRTPGVRHPSFKRGRKPRKKQATAALAAAPAAFAAFAAAVHARAAAAAARGESPPALGEGGRCDGGTVVAAEGGGGGGGAAGAAASVVDDDDTEVSGGTQSLYPRHWRDRCHEELYSTHVGGFDASGVPEWRGAAAAANGGSRRYSRGRRRDPSF